MTESKAGTEPKTDTLSEKDINTKTNEDEKTVNRSIHKTDSKEGNKSVDQSTEKGVTKTLADNTKSMTKTSETETEERVIQEEPVDQKKFDHALKLACLLLKPESVLKHVTKNVKKLHLPRALPLHFSLHVVLSKFENLKVSYHFTCSLSPDFHYEYMPIQIYREFHLQKTEIFQMKNLYFSFFCSNHRLCVLIRMASVRGSNKYPQSMFLSKNKKNNENL